MNRFAPVLKDRAILLGWIAGLVLAASLLWALSFSFRAACLMRSTNRVLASLNDERRLAAPLPRPFAEPVPLGCWYSLAESDSLFFVFTIVRSGILIPCGAEISGQGEVTGIIPLGSHARKAIDQIPPGQIQVHIRRIESSVAKAAKPAEDS